MAKIDVSRFLGGEALEVKVKVLTPMFLGGADGNAELRSAPFKAALRYWWRILYGSTDIVEMKKREDEIFGSTDSASSFSLAVNGNVKTDSGRPPEGKKIAAKSKGKTFPISVIDYLCYGLCDYDVTKRGNVYNKSHIKPDSNFEITLQNIHKVHKESILTSFKALLKFGGVGARSRNGMGSMHCDWSSDFNIVDFFKGDKKTYTSASAHSRVFVSTESFLRWEDALVEIGKLYREARLVLEDRHHFERRGFVARPIVSQNERRIPADVKSGRHPKAYFLGLTKDGGQFRGHILYLPIDFYKQNSNAQYVSAHEDMNNSILGSPNMQEVTR